MEDIRYLLTPKETDSFKHIPGGFIDTLRVNGFAKYILNETGHYQFVAFTSRSLQQFYLGHPEVLSMGYAPNFTACGYLLLIVVGVDKYLSSQSIFFAFINDESLESLRLAVRAFKKLMPACAVSQTTTITVDKPGDLATVIAEELSHVTPIFCQWYLMQSVRAKLLMVPKRQRSYLSDLFTHLMNATTEQDYQHSKEVLHIYSPEFYDYFITHWDCCTPSWANFQLSRRLTFGSKTNNRLRGAINSYRQILDSLDTADGLANNLLEHSHQKSQSRARDDLSTIVCTRVWRDQSPEVNNMLRHISPAVGKMLIEEVNGDVDYGHTPDLKRKTCTGNNLVSPSLYNHFMETGRQCVDTRLVAFREYTILSSRFCRHLSKLVEGNIIAGPGSNRLGREMQGSSADPITAASLSKSKDFLSHSRWSGYVCKLEITNELIAKTTDSSLPSCHGSNFDPI
ncbi:unnamed protein product [Schistocephalus solidus]|uniref:ZSWIM1/3 RNaseH-like domain-containing protein n=1 Tax=Schistocephalus solidus TaxID=70667 RepID=A0A3P7CH58_SCHSO|nr:unnamed protein product [Schistocephalus solidus]